MFLVASRITSLILKLGRFLDLTVTFGLFFNYFWDTPDILSRNRIYGTALAPEVHVGSHVFDDVVVKVVGAEFIWKGSRNHGPPVAVGDPSMLHRFTQCDSRFRFGSQKFANQVPTT